MPYFRNPLLDEQEQEQGEQSQVRIGGGGDVTADPAQASAIAGTASGGKGLQTGSNFQNLDKYLGVNDAAGFSNEFQGKLQQGITQGKQATNQAFSGLMGDVAKYSAPGQEQIKAAVADPVSADASQYQGWINQQYKGPTDIASNQNAFNQVTGAVQGAQDKANLAGSASGRFTLLDSFFGKPTYNMGQKSLDNLLVQKGGGFNASALKGSANSLAQSAKVKEHELQNAASAKVGELEQSRNLARSTLGIDAANNLTGAGALGDFDKGLKERVAATAQASKEKYDRLLGDYASGELSDQDLADLGLSRGQKLYNLDVGGYLSPGDTASAQNVASADDYAKYKALNSLGGLTGQLLTDATQAGSYKGAGVDQGGIKAYLENTQRDYMSQDQAAVDQVQKARDQITELAKQIDAIKSQTMTPANTTYTMGGSGSSEPGLIEQFFGGGGYGGGTNPGGANPFPDAGQQLGGTKDNGAEATKLFEKYKADEIAKVMEKIKEQQAAASAAVKQRDALKKQYNVKHYA